MRGAAVAVDGAAARAVVKERAAAAARRAAEAAEEKPTAKRPVAILKGASLGPSGGPDPNRRGNVRSKYHKNRIFDKIGFLTWFGLVLRSDSESA